MSDTSSFKNKKLKRGLANTIAKARRAQQEVFNGSEVPTLVELAIDVVAANLILYPGLDGIEEDYIKKDIIKKCSRDIPVKVAAQNINYEFFWEDCCNFKLENCKKEDHGNSYKQAFIERYLETLLEKHKSDGNSANLLEELSACRYDCFSLNITQLLSPHIDMLVVFNCLPNLSYLSLTYGAKHVGMEYDRQLFGMKMSDARDFSECLRTTQALVKLALPCNLIDNDLVSILIKGLMLNKTISQLDLSHNRIGNSGACKIGKFLLQTKILTHLDLGDNCIHYQGSRYISQGLKFNKSLKFLSLQLNRIDDKGGMKFCQDLKEHNHTLEELNLRGNSLEDMFGRALAELILDTNLKKIDVSCNFIQKKDATSILESLRDNPRIIEFDIRNNKIKDPAVESEINEIVTKNYLAFLKIPYIKSDHRLNLNLDQNQEVKEDQDPKSPEKN